MCAVESLSDRVCTGHGKPASHGKLKLCLVDKFKLLSADCQSNDVLK